jgi:hypothetical protein
MQTFSETLKFFGNEHTGKVNLQITEDHEYVITIDFCEEIVKGIGVNGNQSFSHSDRGSGSFVGVSLGGVSYNLVDADEKGSG